MIKINKRQLMFLQRSLCKHLMFKMLGVTDWINPVAASVITDNYLEISSSVIQHLSTRGFLYHPNLKLGCVAWPPCFHLSHNGIDKAELKATIAEWMEINRELLVLLPISKIL